MAKEVHIVFQVLNFLHGSASETYQLLPIDKLLLINLASHKGKLGIFPSISKLSKELKYDPRELRRRLNFLESIGLLSIKKMIGKSSEYFLIFPILTQGVETLPIDEVGCTDPGCTDPGCTDPITQGVHTLPTQGVQTPLITKLITKQQLIKDIRVQKKKRTLPKKSQLPEIFTPNETHKALLKSLDMEEELAKFRDYHTTKGTVSTPRGWDAAFRTWLRNAAKFNKPSFPSNGFAKPETRARIQEYGPGHPAWEASRAWERNRQNKEEN